MEVEGRHIFGACRVCTMIIINMMWETTPHNSVIGLTEAARPQRGLHLSTCLLLEPKFSCSLADFTV